MMPDCENCSNGIVGPIEGREPTLSDEGVAEQLVKWQTEVEARVSVLFSEGGNSCRTFGSRLSEIEAVLDAVTKHAAGLEQKLRDAESALDGLRRDHSSAVKLIEQLTRRETELTSDLRETHAAMVRHFDEAPWAICRCSRTGMLTDANRAFIQLLGHPSVDDLRKADFAAAVFESAADLPWLISRSISSTAPATVETTWRTKEGSRLSVRLSASAHAPDTIEIVAEDLTSLRSLQERMGPSQRMEAVGRLASEVAATCANLLNDVHRDAQNWLTAAGTDTSLRHRGEMLLEELTRAGGFLRQLAAYGDEQTTALSRVDLNKVLRDLGPVLNRVAGDDVALELPKTKTPLPVDVRSDRVERLLVNLAGYGRERMPFGGRLKIELATVTVDQTFIEKYPNVRRGQHALITVTEIRRTTRAEGPLRLRDWPAQNEADREPSRSLGVDLGALQDLISDCGGHLWVTAVPRGDMEVQIRLPLCSDAEQNQPAPPAARTRLGLTG